MHTEPAASQAVAVFLFAHQDDEFGVFQTILDCRQQGMRVVCAYLTASPAHSQLAARRDDESRRVLNHLGVGSADIHFAGSLLSIDDASLPLHLGPAAEWLRGWLSSFADIGLIAVPCWEGGHHDHDALHAITVLIARQLQLDGVVRQFSLYNCAGRMKPFFNVLSPLPSNGPIESRPISWGNRLRFLRFCLSYPSQLLTWIGLFPFVLLHYLIRGRQTLQSVSADRLSERPHHGALYYERRDFFTWKEMQARLLAWRLQE